MKNMNQPKSNEIFFFISIPTKTVGEAKNRIANTKRQLLNRKENKFSEIECARSIVKPLKLD